MKLIHELVSEYAAAHPSKAAAADYQGEISYGELEARSASGARALVSLGMGVGDAAAVYVPYSKEILLGALSVLRAGGIYIPFDAAHPVERMETVLSDSAAKAVLTVRELWNRKPLHFPAEKLVFLDELTASDESFSCPEGLSADSPAMLLYTSGTTGRPKGVLHTHKMLVNLMDWTKNHEGSAMGEATRAGVMAGFTFVAAQAFLFGPLTGGGTACIVPEEARQDLGFLYRFIREAGITHIFLSSSLAAILAEEYDISGLFVCAGGEKLRNFRAHTHGNYVINVYGSTETASVLSKAVFGSEERILTGRPPIGTLARIVDEEMKPVASGEAGELLISSPFMSHAYYHLPELTAEKWVTLEGTLWFRTGDRARCTPEGDYDILGRADNMVKLRGFRIETGEVEVQVANTLIRLGRSDVKQNVVVLKTVSGTDYLCCYYEAEKELEARAVKEEIARNLTEYMIPDIWVRMDALPRNANGKVMRKELPQPTRKREQVIGPLDSEVLARLVYTAADVLGTEELISPDDRFTDLGGTSLTAMKYTALLRQQGIKVTIAQVLQLNVLRDIAAAAEVRYEQLWSQEEFQKVREDFASRGEQIQEVLPITSAQDEMLFEQLINPDRIDNRDFVFLQTSSPVSEKDLREALDIVSEENKTLRSAIVFRHVTTVQQVVTNRRIPLEIVDMETLGNQEKLQFRDRILHAPMDLQRDSMVRVAYIRAEGSYYLCVLTHRIAFGQTERRAYLARLMGVLAERCPDDKSIIGWREVFEESLSGTLAQERSTLRKRVQNGMKKDIPQEICVYSENNGPKVVFVHTANTGSSAYYQLAARIGGQVSFAVIEPYNLYHMEQARYGVRNIAAKYIEILKRYQPEGPYLLGGWCYGGVVAHEMACQLEQAGEDVRLLVLLDAHAIASQELREISRGMTAEVNREYFETSPLFADLRESGMLDAMVANAAHTTEDMVNHTPSFYHGDILYFKPDRIPSGISEESRRYWEKMMEFEAGNYEHYCARDRLRIVHTPHEHDLMMDEASLDIIVPELMKAMESHIAEGER
ncbi:MAG: AMP-binding protein [Clostridia bacterium]|nr:AMP-binding protein [Clostridia bacterium]